MSFVIGCAGQAQMGKDTLADKLCERLNANHNEKVDEEWKTSTELEELLNPWTRSAFASNVKKVYCDTFNVDAAFVEQWKTKAENPPGFDMPVRQALQFIGDGFRKIRGTIWLDLAFTDSVPKIISDVRYVNEFTRIKQEGGLNILIGRTNKLNDDTNGSEAQIRPYLDWCFKSFSPSAKFVDMRDMDWKSIRDRQVYDPPKDIEMFDVFIRNDGTIEELYEIIEEKLVPYVQHFVFEFKGE
jgi:hypothetical protein